MIRRFLHRKCDQEIGLLRRQLYMSKFRSWRIVERGEVTPEWQKVEPRTAEIVRTTTST